MKQRIFSHFQDYLIQYISHQYQDLLYCNSSKYILSTYNSQHNNNNNVVLAMTMPNSGQGWRHSALRFGSCTIIVYVFNPDHYIGIVIGIVIANTTLLLLLCWLICRQNILRTITIKEVLILVTNILDQIVLKVWEYSLFHLRLWNLINNNNKY
jgi:hypothetical protein